MMLSHKKDYGKFERRVNFQLGIDKEDLVYHMKEDKDFKKLIYNSIKEVIKEDKKGKDENVKEENGKGRKDKEDKVSIEDKEECEINNIKKNGRYSSDKSTKGDIIFFKDIQN